LLRLILPLAVTRNLFAADLLVLIFGTAHSFEIDVSGNRRLMLLGRQQHRHASPLQTGFDIELGDILHLNDHPSKHLAA
jgi:hypothetical protein